MRPRLPIGRLVPRHLDRAADHKAGPIDAVIRRLDLVEGIAVIVDAMNPPVHQSVLKISHSLGALSSCPSRRSGLFQFPGIGTSGYLAVRSCSVRAAHNGPRCFAGSPAAASAREGKQCRDSGSASLRPMATPAAPTSQFPRPGMGPVLCCWTRPLRMRLPIFMRQKVTRCCALSNWTATSRRR